MTQTFNITITEKTTVQVLNAENLQEATPNPRKPKV